LTVSILKKKKFSILFKAAAVIMATVLLLYPGMSQVRADEGDWQEEEQWAAEDGWQEEEQWAAEDGWQEEEQWAAEDGWQEEEQWAAEDGWQEEEQWAAEDGWQEEEQWAAEDGLQEEEQAAADDVQQPEDTLTAADDGLQEENEQQEDTLQADDNASGQDETPEQDQTPAAGQTSVRDQNTDRGSVAGQNWPEAPELAGEAVVLMEANTQAVIYEKNPTEKMYPASTTKILTAIVVLEHCNLNEMVTCTEECCDLEDGAVTIDSVPGEQMKLKDVMYGLLLPSGNDCAMALAIHTAGSVSAFVDMMNEKAREIGALSSHFMNPSGLFNSNHYTTASDLALIARYAFQNSTFVDIISHPTYIIEPTNLTSESRVLINTHEMITPGNPDYNSNVIGGKTGYLYESGRCLVTYADKDGVTLLAVILDGSYYGIFGETQELLDFGWDNFRIVNVSESERRFSYSDDSAKVQLDPSSEIVTLNNMPFNALSSRINYAYYLNDREYAKAKEAAGIKQGDPRQLYAQIDYYYAGYYLGSCNVFINPDLTYRETSFITMVYVNIWLVLLIVILVILTVVLIVRRANKIRNENVSNAKAHRKSGRARVRYYNRSDSVDLRNQYIKRGNKDRQSIHDLNDIGIPHGRKTNTGFMSDMNTRYNNGGAVRRTQQPRRRH